jgi:putative transposase
MKRKRYSSEQIVSILKEAEAGLPIVEVCRKYGVSQGTYFRWKSKYSGLEVSDVRKMRELTDENGRLKRIVADQLLQIDAMKAVLQKKW